MRKLVRRGMSPKEGDPIKQPKELSPEQLSLAEERNAARIMRRKVAEFWSKQPHGFTSQDLYCVRTINLHSCSLNDDDGEALASVPPTVATMSKQGAVNASRSEVVLVHAPHGDYVFCVITKNQQDQSWGDDNAGFVLLRDVSRILWQHFEPTAPYAAPAGAARFR